MPSRLSAAAAERQMIRAQDLSTPPSRRVLRQPLHYRRCHMPSPLAIPGAHIITPQNSHATRRRYARTAAPRHGVAYAQLTRHRDATPGR